MSVKLIYSAHIALLLREYAARGGVVTVCPTPRYNGALRIKRGVWSR